MNSFEKRTFRFNARLAKRCKFATKEWQHARHVVACRAEFSNSTEKPFVVYYGNVCSCLGYESIYAARLAMLQWCMKNKRSKYAYQIKHFPTQIVVFNYSVK